MHPSQYPLLIRLLFRLVAALVFGNVLQVGDHSIPDFLRRKALALAALYIVFTGLNSCANEVIEEGIPRVLPVCLASTRSSCSPDLRHSR